MKKSWIIVVNVVIMIAIFTFVVLYSGFESRDTYQRQIEHFENTNDHDGACDGKLSGGRAAHL